MTCVSDKKRVIGISSNALFDLKKEEGLAVYRNYQFENKLKVLEKGVAFPFIKWFLHINYVYLKKPVEVVLL